jgi:radical SAM superfamily enzyme YgiQ (UPF0313 family)
LAINQKLLAPDHLQKSLAHIRERLNELSQHPSPDDGDGMEKEKMEHILSILERMGNDFKYLFNIDLPASQKIAMYHVYIRLATLKYYPEFIEFTFNMNSLRYHSSKSNFSSRDILSLSHHKGMVRDLLTQPILEKIAKVKPTLLGLSVTFPDQITPAVQLAAIIKKKYRRLHICLGGAFVSSHLREINNPQLFSLVDSLILDDGEGPLVELYHALQSQTPDLAKIPQMIYFSNNKIQFPNPHLPCRYPQKEIPDYHEILSSHNYLINHQNMALLYRFIHGCYWARCTFCKTGLPLIKNVQPYEVESLYRQIKSDHIKKGHRIFQFSDDSADAETLTQFARLIIRDSLNINWVVLGIRCERTFTMDVCMLLKKSGCGGLYMGVEAFNNRLLKMMKKGINTSLINSVIGNMSRAGIALYLYMMVGFPTETEEEALHTFNQVKRFLERGDVRRIIYNVFEIHPYTDIWNHPDKYGISHFQYKKERDLLPPVTMGFNAQGMSRQRAVELCNQFVWEIKNV